MHHIEKIKNAEKEINTILLKIIIGFSFLVDGKNNISIFIKNHSIEIMTHLSQKYQKIKKYYKAFKIRHKEYIKNNKYKK